jgi:hypothetical protein
MTPVKRMPFRAIACTLVIALLPDPGLRLRAQTPQPAVSVLDEIEASDPRNLPSAQQLAKIPDSMPMPPDVVDPARSTRVAVESAVNHAGFDLNQGSTTRNADGSMTFTGIYDDGNITVTGRVVDGRLELRKEFQPLLNSGDVGERIPIHGKPSPSDSQAASAPPTEQDVQAQIEATVQRGYQQLLQRAKQVEGPRTVDVKETGGFLSSKGETFITFPDYTIAGLLGARDMYVRQLMAFLSEMSDLRLLSPQAVAERVNQLIALAKQAETWSMLSSLGGVGSVDQALTIARQAADAAERSGDAQLAAAIRDILAQPADRRFALFREKFIETLDRDPLLAIDELWKKLADGGSAAAHAGDFADAVRSAIDRTHEEINRVGGLTTAAQLAEFLKPQYGRTRQLAAAILGGPFAKLFAQLEEFASAYLEVKQDQAAVRGLEVALFSVVISGIGYVIAAPVALAGSAGAAKAIVAGAGTIGAQAQLMFNTDRLFGGRAEAANARNAVGALGASTVDALDQQAHGAMVAVLMDVAFVALAVSQLRAALAEIQAARAGQPATVTTAAAGATGARGGVAAPGGPLGSSANVQRGAQRARELGIRQDEIDFYLAEANGQAPANASLDIQEAIHVERAQHAAALVQVGQIDDLIAAARQAGVPSAEIDALIAAARQQGTMAAWSRNLPAALIRRTMEQRGIIPVVDQAPNAAGGPALQRFLAYFNGILPATWMRTDLVAVSRIIGNLRFMQAGRLVRWAAGDIELLQRILANPNASRMYGFISDERLFVQLFPDDILETGRQFVSAPNSVGIAAGHVPLVKAPPVPTAPLAVPAAPATGGALTPLLPLMLTGDEARRALDAWRQRADTTAPTGDAPAATGDFNGDGTPDSVSFVAPGSTRDPRIACSRSSLVIEAPAGTVTSAAAADINGDGIDDLILGGSGPDGTGRIDVALGGTFLHPGAAFRFNQPATPAIQLPTPPIAVAAGPLNADRRADVAVAVAAGGGKGGVYVYPSMATESARTVTFGSRQVLDLPVVPSGIAIGESNGQPNAPPDTDADLFITSPSGLQILENDSSGPTFHFNPSPIVPAPPARQIFLQDLDGDGRLDINTVQSNGVLSTSFARAKGGGYYAPIQSVTGGMGQPLVRDPLFFFAILPSRDVTVTADTPTIDVNRAPATPPPTMTSDPAGADPRRGTNAWPGSSRWGDYSAPLFDEGGLGDPGAGPLHDAVLPLRQAAADDRSQLEIVFVGGGEQKSSLGAGALLHGLAALFFRHDARALNARLYDVTSARATRTSQGSGARRSPLSLLFTSLGVSTGEAFRLQALGDPSQLGLGALVVEPLKDVKPDAIARAAKALDDRGAATMTAVGYCLEFVKEPPRGGMAYRVAPREVQRRFEPLRRVAEAAQRLKRAGALTPDSDPASFFHSIAQWAIWAKEQKFSQETFKRALIDHTKKNVLRGGREWKKEMEQVVERVVPNRWQQIQTILREAEK